MLIDLGAVSMGWRKSEISLNIRKVKERKITIDKEFELERENEIINFRK